MCVFRSWINIRNFIALLRSVSQGGSFEVQLLSDVGFKLIFPLKYIFCLAKLFVWSPVCVYIAMLRLDT